MLNGSKSLPLACALILAPTPSIAQQRALALDTEARATLGAPGDSLRAGKPQAVWTFIATAAGTLQFTLRSAAFDAYLVLQEPDGRFVDFDDNSGGGTDAKLTREVTAGTRYRVLVRSLTDAAGAYTLAVRTFDRASEGLAGPITRGQDITGTLAAGDPTVSGGRPYRAYTYEAQAGDSIQVDLTSDAFDTFLIVQDAQGRSVAENDDFEGLNSRVTVRLTAAGRYRIVATAFNAGATGAFRLRMQ